MIEKEIELIRQIAEPALHSTIALYARWYVTSGVYWVVAGVALLLIGVHRFMALPKPDTRDVTDAKLQRLAWAAVALLGGIFVGVNLPDMLNPEATAIHNLLRDLRGGR